VKKQRNVVLNYLQKPHKHNIKLSADYIKKQTTMIIDICASQCANLMLHNMLIWTYVKC